jgi:hypothetical protein
MAHALDLIRVQASDPVLPRLESLLQRIMVERCGEPLPLAGAYPKRAKLTLALDAALGAESYAIRDNGESGIVVAGGTPRGLLYGVGRLLREATYTPGCFTPGAWRGSASPMMPIRGAYFAIHFHNWYQEAPLAELERYVEELALWGYNTVFIWFDAHHFNSIDDPAAQVMLERLLAVAHTARRIGLDVGLLIIANEGYGASPVELRAQWAVQNGYHHEPVGHFHVEICPSVAGGTELILHEFEEKLRVFAQVQPDYLVIWPYDVGACTCKACAPFGSRALLPLARAEAELYRRYVPRGKVVLSTWYFDHYTTGEWVGLGQAFTPPPAWVDYLLADDYGDTFPPYPLEHGAPGGLPVIGFPEISMYRCYPWSGYGANPLPQHLQDVWQPAKGLLCGGFPYSEGIYEDINKAICAQLYWDPDQPTATTLRQYLAYEFGLQVVEPVYQAIAILERNLPRQLARDTQGSRILLERTSGASEAWQLIQQAELVLSPERRLCWRWRQIALRALIDSELAVSEGVGTPASEAAFQELTTLYHEETADHYVAPPARTVLAALHGADSVG